MYIIPNESGHWLLSVVSSFFYICVENPFNDQLSLIIKTICRAAVPCASSLFHMHSYDRIVLISVEIP